MTSRQDESDARADLSDARQDKQDIRQDNQDDCILVTQKETVIRQDEQEQRQDQQEDTQLVFMTQVEGIAGGVEVLAGNVKNLCVTLGDKNKIDRNRNIMIVGAAVSFIFLAVVLVFLLNQIRDNGSKETARGEERAQEAIVARRQLSDCQLPPGVVLPDGFVNPGTCFKDTALRTKTAIDGATEQIKADTQEILRKSAEATAANRALSDEVRQAARTQAGALKPTTIPPTRQTPTSTARTPPPTPPSPTPPPTAQPQDDPSLTCTVLRFLGAC